VLHCHFSIVDLSFIISSLAMYKIRGGWRICEQGDIGSIRSVMLAAHASRILDNTQNKIDLPDFLVTVPIM
jgi:uncharacterized membrane protein YozB (DUF420 family)